MSRGRVSTREKSGAHRTAYAKRQFGCALRSRKSAAAAHWKPSRKGCVPTLSNDEAALADGVQSSPSAALLGPLQELPARVFELARGGEVPRYASCTEL